MDKIVNCGRWKITMTAYMTVTDSSESGFSYSIEGEGVKSGHEKKIDSVRLDVTNLVLSGTVKDDRCMRGRVASAARVAGATRVHPDVDPPIWEAEYIPPGEEDRE